MDTTREKFTVIGKQAKAIGAGIQAATEIEKVKGNFLDYQTQLEVTQQKGVNFDVAQTKTFTDRNIAVHTKTDLAERLKQAEIKAQESAAKTLEAQGKLNAFKQQLGEYLPK
jgi:chromosome condensin MukBEF ATPase and DNA-binding subunit MukB